MSKKFFNLLRNFCIKNKFFLLSLILMLLLIGIPIYLLVHSTNLPDSSDMNTSIPLSFEEENLLLAIENTIQKTKLQIVRIDSIMIKQKGVVKAISRHKIHRCKIIESELKIIKNNFKNKNIKVEEIKNIHLKLVDSLNQIPKINKEDFFYKKSKND